MLENLGHSYMLSDVQNELSKLLRTSYLLCSDQSGLFKFQRASYNPLWWSKRTLEALAMSYSDSQNGLSELLQANYALCGG